MILRTSLLSLNDNTQHTVTPLQLRKKPLAQRMVLMADESTI
jgi:hypothetical protein